MRDLFYAQHIIYAEQLRGNNAVSSTEQNQLTRKIMQKLSTKPNVKNNLIIEVTLGLRLARLVLEWVTVAGNLSRSNQPSRPTQPDHPAWVDATSTSQLTVMVCG